MYVFTHYLMLKCYLYLFSDGYAFSQEEHGAVGQVSYITCINII